MKLYRAIEVLRKTKGKLRGRLLKLFLLSCGKNFIVLDGTHFWNPSFIEIGSNVFINEKCMFDAGYYGINIEDNVIIGPGVYIYSFDHAYDKNGYKRKEYNGKKINIRKNVWIGAGSIILKGVTIGKGSIIGAGSVITKNVPDNCIVTGNKIKPIK